MGWAGAPGGVVAAGVVDGAAAGPTGEIVFTAPGPAGPNSAVVIGPGGGLETDGDATILTSCPTRPAGGHGGEIAYGGGQILILCHALIHDVLI